MPQVMGSLAAGLATVLLMMAAASPAFSEETGDLRLNQLQFIGTHNSYHVALPKSPLEKLGRINRNWKNSLNYTHRSLTGQLEDLGVRHFELDLFADPKGGHL